VEAPVKGLLKILLAGFAVFMVFSVAQQWEFFSSAWFASEKQRERLPDEEREAAADAVRMTLNLTRHLYASGGDTRFAERIPAGGGIIDEIVADVDYLARNHRVQDPELLQLELLSVVELSLDRVEIATREDWRVRTLLGVGGREADPPTSQTIEGKYLVVRGGKGWRVEGWELVDLPAPGSDPAE